VDFVEVPDTPGQSIPRLGPGSAANPATSTPSESADAATD
jgi:hypothetical protein